MELQLERSNINLEINSRSKIYKNENIIIVWQDLPTKEMDL